MDALEQLKKDVDDLSYALAQIAGKVDIDPKTVFVKTKGDMAMAMLNLAASDGYFDVHEAVAISEALGLDMSREEMLNVIKTQNLPSVDLLQEVPASLKFLCEIDRAMRNAGKESNLCGALLDIYNRLFVLMVIADGEKNKNELMSHAIMLKVMVDYVDANK